VSRTLPLTAALSALLLAGCSYGVLAPAGPVGRAERLVLLNSLAIMLTIVIPTIIATLFFAWRYRASNTRARYLPHFAYSGRLELIIWSIPTLIILFLGGVIWAGSHDLDPMRPLPARETPLEVQVVSLDWKWLFIYPEQRIASVNELVIPAGRPVHFSLTSGRVMNMFWVPKLGGMIATMNRMVTQISLQADEPGRYDGRSTQFSGDGFSDMRFTTRAISPNEFSAWADATRHKGPVLNEAAYVALSQQSRDVRPFTYREANPALFHAIVSQSLPPGPGPSDAQSNAAVRPTGGH
jgi:cytochrome o ubiquinol oxidase subunit 2